MWFFTLTGWLQLVAVVAALATYWSSHPMDWTATATFFVMLVFAFLCAVARIGESSQESGAGCLDWTIAIFAAGLALTGSKLCRSGDRPNSCMRDHWFFPLMAIAVLYGLTGLANCCCGCCCEDDDSTTTGTLTTRTATTTTRVQAVREINFLAIDDDGDITIGQYRQEVELRG